MGGVKKEAIIPIKLLYVDDIEKNKKALAEAQAELEKFESRVTNKTGWIYRRGLEKRMKIRSDAIKRLSVAEINAERILQSKKTSIAKAGSQERAKNEILESKKVKKAQADEERKRRNTYVSKWKAAFGTLSRYASAYMLINLGVQAFKEVAKEILNVQANLAKVKAISGATNSDMSKLKDTVWEISAGFGKSATEVSKFTIQMAKLGKSAVEIREIATESAQLSSILGEDMVQSGTLLVTTMNQFGLSTKEAGRVASTFFDTIANSPADVDGLRTAMQYVGVTASNLGLSIEQTGRMIGFLANNGMKMSKVGTGLRNVLSKISQKGGDLNDVLEKMHENGLSTMDAFSEFGKRGGNAALLLVNHWEEVKKLMNEDIPTAAERILKSAQAMNSATSYFGRYWRAFIASFSDINAMRKLSEQNGLIELSNALSDAGIKTKTLDEDISKLAKRYDNVKDIFTALSNKYFGDNNPLSADKVERVTNALAFVVKATFEEQKSNKVFDDVRGKIKDFMQEKLKEIEETGNDFSGELADLPAPEDGVQTIPFGIAPKPANFVNKLPYRTQLDRFTKMIEDKLPSIDPKDARKIAKDALSRATTTLRTSIRYTVEEYAKQIKKIQKENADILATGKTNQSDMATIEANDQAIKDLMAIICRMSPLYDGCTKAKKLKKKIDYTIRDAINAYERWYNETRAKIRAAYAEAISKESRINDVTIDNKKSPLSLTDYMAKMGFDPKKHTVKDQNEFIDTYEKYATDFLTKLSVRIHATADKAKELAETTYRDNAAALGEQITNLNSLLSKVDSSNMTASQKDTAKENIKNKISKHKIELINLEKEYRTTVNKTDSDEEKAIKRLLVLLEKVGFVKKKSQVDLDKDGLALKKEAIQMALDEALTAYNRFNDAVLQNTTDRLNAEKEAITAHYNEANDILKAQEENQLITAGQYAKRRKALEKKKIDEENRIKKAQFDAKKKADYETAIVTAAVQAASAAVKTLGEGGIAAAPLIAVTEGIIAVELATQLAAISSRKFYPTKYATGGWINGDSHANGGVPISIKSGGSIEAEGGEMIINKNAAAKNASLLESINSGNDLTEQIKTAFESARIRAFFTDKDLDAAERSRTFNNNTANYMN